jgi:hypothetical protein
VKERLARSAAILGVVIAVAPALAQDKPFFYVEKQCKTLPLEAARAWCMREERCNEKWLADSWRGVTAGVSRDAVTTCVTIAKAAQTYQYWTLRRCLAPASDTGDCR